MAETKQQLAPHDEWIAKLDLKAFGKDMRELGDTLLKNQGEADAQHLDKIVMWNWMFSLAGLATLWMSPNIFTVVCLSTGLFSRWAILAHHTMHGGFDNTPAADRGYNRWVFAVGSLVRRVVDWFDWILPEAWNLEHGRLHHYSLNEDNDPDLVQKNAAFVRNSNMPLAAKYAVVFFFMITWKFTYYSSNTFCQYLLSIKLKELSLSNSEQAEAEREALVKEKNAGRHIVTWFSMLDGSVPSWWDSKRYFSQVAAPFLLSRFIMIPAIFGAVLGKQAFYNAAINMLLAELLTNAHAFLAIVTNHAGEDLYYFEDHCEANSDEFFLRQVIGSADFSSGNDYIDFFHGWLSYQAEHHAWPKLSMLSYQKSQPLLKAVCEKHGVPYVQHNVFWRLHKTVQVFVGTNDMRLFPKGVLKTE